MAAYLRKALLGQNVLPAEPSGNWKLAWKNKMFRLKLAFGLLIITGILYSLPSFFHAIELRNGRVVNDVVLRHLPAYNVSGLVFLLVWSMAAFTTWRAVQQPYIFILFLWSFIFLTLVRIAAISIHPLDPPRGLIPLVDPLSNYFYKGTFITKDLFFSGHTATQCLMFLCMRKPTDRIVLFLSILLLAALLLVQHVHYTIDVLAAPFFTYCCYMMGKWVVKERSYSIE
jgi:hypothetical protein